jgi:U3 small nucleolar RNA-associated protein 14
LVLSDVSKICIMRTGKRDKKQRKLSKKASRKRPPKQTSNSTSSTPKTTEVTKDMGLDVYEEDIQPMKELDPKRFDRLDVYEYDLPSDFEDEEIDEDLAFDEADEARYGEFFASREDRTRKMGNSDRDNNNYYDEMEGETLEDNKKPGTWQAGRYEARNEVDDLFEEGGISEEDDLSDEECDDIEDLDSAQVDLGQFLSSHGKLEKESGETVGILGRNDQEETMDLTLEDLIASAHHIVDHKKLSRLISTEKRAVSSADQSKKASTNHAMRDLLPAPLSRNIQERIQREAAYVETSKDISKWASIVRRYHEADQLQFPLNESKPGLTTHATLVAQFKAETAMEHQIAEALVASGMQKPDVTESHALTLNDSILPPLGLKESGGRQEELEKARSYLFFHEQKLKRLAKIKSKGFRKLLKKEKARTVTATSNTRQMSKPTQEDLLNYERERAKERMSLKNRARLHQLKCDLEISRENPEGDDEDDQEVGVMEGILDGNPCEHILSAKNDHPCEWPSDANVPIKYLDLGESDGFRKSYSIPMNEPTKFLDGSSINVQGFDQEEENSPSIPKKGLFAMKFMQRAMERRQNEIQSLKARLNEELVAESSRVTERPLFLKGRRVFGLSQTSITRPIQQRSRDGEDLEEQQNTKMRSASYSTADINRDSDSSVESDPNRDPSPSILQIADFSDQKDQDGRLLCETFSTNTGGNALIARIPNPSLDRTDTVQSVPAIRLVHENSRLGPSKFAKNTLKMTEKVRRQESRNSPDSLPVAELRMDEENDVSPEEPSQKDLIRRAFADDNIFEKDFEEEKAKLIELEIPKEEVLTLPGWGHWAGDGTKGPKHLLVKRPHPDAIDRIVKGRKDSHLKHVIIQERINKKALSFMADHVPFPFETHAQYEQSIRNPLGPEWNTQTTFQRLIRPRIMTKTGAVIDPIKLSQKELQQVKREKRANPFSVTLS